MELSGTPSDQLPDVLATGVPDTTVVFVSMTGREPDGRDADYLQWHSLDHRPEQFRLDGIRHSVRLVSTPACRSARAASEDRYDAVDHVMTYFFAHVDSHPQFEALSVALGGERRPFRLPSVDAGYFDLVGKAAAPRAIAGSDVLPWRPALGVYLLVEEGTAAADALCEVPGVAGVWWHEARDRPGTQLTYAYLDDDPVAVAERLRDPLAARWSGGNVRPLLAAPFHTVVPFEWDRYLP